VRPESPQLTGAVGARDAAHIDLGCRLTQRMANDLQLQSVRLEAVLEKRRLDQALNAKEFAVLAGISYSTAREWFRLPGFPVLRGVVFWGDFVEWRRSQTGLGKHSPSPPTATTSVSAVQRSHSLPPKAARILAEFG